MQVVGAVELQVAQEYLPLPDDSGTVPFSADLDYILASCHPGDYIAFPGKIIFQQLQDTLFVISSIPARESQISPGIELIETLDSRY